MALPAEFFESWPLFRAIKAHETFQQDLLNAMPAFTAHCPRCGLERTFSRHEADQDKSTKLGKGPSRATAGAVMFIRSICAACSQPTLAFLIRFHESNGTAMKVGQYPPYSIKIEPDLAKVLAEYSERYRHGLVCESQGYGIGAFAYYRRIVEGILDRLLDEVADLIPLQDRSQYDEALQRTKTTRVAQEKIDLVKDLLPLSLRPAGMNPLGVLHSALSEGLHSLEEEECLTLAEQVRGTLEYLISQVSEAKRAKAKFTESMRGLLDKKSQQNAKATPPAAPGPAGESST